jgi:hypothetical protein
VAGFAYQNNVIPLLFQPRQSALPYLRYRLTGFFQKYTGTGNGYENPALPLCLGEDIQNEMVS